MTAGKAIERIVLKGNAFRRAASTPVQNGRTGRDLLIYFAASSTNRCVLVVSTALALNGRVKVVPSYHAFHWSM